MTKAARIIALHKRGKSVRDIALAVYGHDLCRQTRRVKEAYVRVVLRQRKGTSNSEIDRRYLANKYKTDSEWRARRFAAWSEHSKKWAQTEHGRAWQRNYKRDWQRRKRAAFVLADSGKT